MKKTFKIDNLCCAHCASEIQSEIEQLDGVTSVGVSFITQKLVLDADENKMEDILKQVSKIVRKIEPDCKLVY